MKNLLTKLKQIAKENPDGFTVSIPSCEFVQKGWVIAMKETQNSFGETGLEKVIAIALETTNVVGGWKDGKFYFDACYVVENEEEATKLGIENEQIAIFNIDQLKVKRLL